MIPVSVLITVKNEEKRLVRCLAALSGFDEIVVIDSGSADQTTAIARERGARVEHFSWNGQYPKKRQWCLDNLKLKHDWIFFVDADEEITPELKCEIEVLFSTGVPEAAGYFVDGLYVMDCDVLKHGLRNSKLVLFDRRAIAFPVVDDLDVPGMGEMEGHYQPVLKSGGKIGRLSHAMLHHAYEGTGTWEARHERYAAWERGMNAKNAWPRDPVLWRQILKQVFRAMPGRAYVAFLHAYILKAGFRDGRLGFDLARDRWRYYRLIGRRRS